MDEERAAFPAATYPTGIVPNTTFVNVPRSLGGGRRTSQAPDNLKPMVHSRCEFSSLVRSSAVLLLDGEDEFAQVPPTEELLNGKSER